jgi:single-strand DNA-binding protein
MMSLNRATIIGNLTRDPEVRTTTGGQSVASFGVATNFSWTDQSGQKQERVEYHNVVAWGKLAEICGQYLGKGRKVYVEGRLQTREWEGQDKLKRKTTEIICESMIMLDRGNAPAAGATAGATRTNVAAAVNGANAAQASQPASVPSNDNEIRVEDIPF